MGHYHRVERLVAAFQKATGVIGANNIDGWMDGCKDKKMDR